MQYKAHSEKNGNAHSLKEHLTQTAFLAEQFAKAFEAGDLAQLAGWLHDLGKTSERFQRYLDGIGETGGDHKAAGFLYAQSLSAPPPVLFAIAGHHGGLLSLADMKGKLGASTPKEAHEAANELYDDTFNAFKPCLPSWLSTTNKLEVELLIRMVFSALVDADFLDTEAHFQPEHTQQRGQYPSLNDLWQQCAEHYEKKFGDVQCTPVNTLRREVYETCLKAAAGPQGAFSLTVPTGGGKTLSSLAFALRHAIEHRLDRVIFVIPYTSIIEQTVDVFAQYLERGAIIEHHSAVDADMHDEDHLHHKLAAENWDAPVVVTTAVQFFESLFAHKPGKCRKLHNIARSVVIIDEAQTLPLGLLKPTFAMLAELVRHYGVTCLLTTATQPAYSTFTDMEIREIMPDPTGLTHQLKRVKYHHIAEPLDWDKVAEQMSQCAQKQAMAVLNTRADARALFEKLPPESRIHLSTNICGAHRREVLKQVRARLQNEETCLLATTQLVEAGVDLDFPLVLRAMGPLERIVQAAGRCNREGKNEYGTTIVFEPKEGGLPPGSYKTATSVTRMFFKKYPEIDLNLPEAHHKYFTDLYIPSELDAKNITQLRESFDFPEVAKTYRIIAAETVAVAVPWRDGAKLLEDVAKAGFVTRDDFRKLQPYFVGMRFYEMKQACEQGLCGEVVPGSGLWKWEGGYDEDIGLQWEFDVLTI